MISIIVTRDSVCAGDDVDAPHEIVLTIEGSLTKELLLQKVAKQTVDIHYPEQKWVCVWNGENVAEYSKAGTIVNCNKMTVAKSNVVHFRYEWVASSSSKNGLG